MTNRKILVEEESLRVAMNALGGTIHRTCMEYKSDCGTCGAKMDALQNLQASIEAIPQEDSSEVMRKGRHAFAVLKQHARHQCTTPCPQCDELRAALVILDNMSYRGDIDTLLQTPAPSVSVEAIPGETKGEQQAHDVEYYGKGLEEGGRNERARIVQILDDHLAAFVSDGHLCDILRQINIESADTPARESGESVAMPFGHGSYIRPALPILNSDAYTRGQLDMREAREIIEGLVDGVECDCARDPHDGDSFSCDPCRARAFLALPIQNPIGETKGDNNG